MTLSYARIPISGILSRDQSFRVAQTDLVWLTTSISHKLMFVAVLFLENGKGTWCFWQSRVHVKH